MGDLINKQRVAESFSKAASTYDSVAGLQRDIGHRLLEKLFVHQQESELASILDLGCGTGYFTTALNTHYPDTLLTGLDIASGMLDYARRHRSLDRPLDQQVSWVCGDAESLPLKSECYSLVFSSLAIQWCENSPALFSEISRVLHAGGIACLATLGPQTLCELRRAWSHVDSYQHVNQFQSMEALLGALPDNLELIDSECEMQVLHYPHLKEHERPAVRNARSLETGHIESAFTLTKLS